MVSKTQATSNNVSQMPTNKTMAREENLQVMRDFGQHHAGRDHQFNSMNRLSDQDVELFAEAIRKVNGSHKS